jgi:hypothetical protein
MINQPPQMPFMAGQQQLPSPQQPGAPMVQISPQVSDALKTIAQGMQSYQQQPPMLGQMPIDKNSPQYKQAMMQQLASTGPMGAIGSVIQQMGDAQRARQADANAWMPTVTRGE